MTILFVNGINDRSVIGINLDSKGQVGYLIDGNCSIYHRLELQEDAAFEYTLFGKGVQQRRPEFRQKPSLIFNQISDADTHKGALRRCESLCDQLGVPVLNHPRHILQSARERVANKLQNIAGVIMPRTTRFTPGSPEETLEYAASKEFPFPYIVRVAGDHHGKRMVVIKEAGDLPLLHVLPFDGRDFYLTEYVDFRDDAGLYHKQRIIVVDGEPLLRHSLYTDSWMVHASAREFMLQREGWKEDIERFDQLSSEVIPGLRNVITEITERLQLEYYGIDCCLLPDGQMLVFEANANMNALHSPNPATRYRVEAIEQKLYAMLAKYSGETVH